jgi:hypothetical protein
MSKSQKRINGQRKRYSTPLSGHKRDKRQLVPPMARLENMTPTQWGIDRLPDFLWSHHFLSEFGHTEFHGLLDFLSNYDDGTDAIIDGTLSALERIPITTRGQLLSEMPAHMGRQIASWSHIAKLYPEMPGHWLFVNEVVHAESETYEFSIGLLKRLVIELLPRRGQAASLAKLFMIARFANAGKFHASDRGMIDRFAGYPNLNKDELDLAAAEIGATSGALFMMRPLDSSWAQHFWRQNFSISSCEPVKRAPPPIDSSRAHEKLTELARIAVEFEHAEILSLEKITVTLNLDLWLPRRQEVLLALLARQLRLTLDVLGSLDLWQLHSGSHLVRHQVENLITIEFLEKHPKLYETFVETGLGQLKLYKLHLQEIEENADDQNPYLREVIDELEGIINQDISEEFVTINLGNWAGMNLRQMSDDVGRLAQYQLTYQPCSIDAHSTWTSLAGSHLIPCGNPLHRFHRIVHYGRPMPDLGLIHDSIGLFRETLVAVCTALNVDAPVGPLDTCAQRLAVVFTDSPNTPPP